jgi:cytoskeletal protein CcmA (bactofilin family)
MSFFSGRRQQETEEHPTAPRPTKAAPPPAPRQPVGFETVLGVSATLSGDLRSQGNIRLDGVFEGTLEIEGNILVGETAKITADINARNISIAGAVRGNVNGNKVQILRTGRVWGDINAAAITTEEGAFIDGKITMITHEAALQGFEPPSLPEPEVEEPDFLAAASAMDEVKEEAEEEAPPAYAGEPSALDDEFVADEDASEEYAADEDEDEDVYDSDADEEDEDDVETMKLGDLPIDDDGAIG